MSDEIKGAMRIVQMWAKRFENWITARMDAVEAPTFLNIRSDPIELKKTIRILTKKVDAIPFCPPPMALLAAPMVDVVSLGLEFYYPT